MKKMLIYIYILGIIATALGNVKDAPDKIVIPGGISMSRRNIDPLPNILAPKGMQAIIAPKGSRKGSPKGSPKAAKGPKGPVSDNQFNSDSKPISPLSQINTNASKGERNMNLNTAPPAKTEAINSSTPDSSSSIDTGIIPSQTIEKTKNKPVADLSQDANRGDSSNVQSVDGKLTTIIITVSLFCAALAIAGIYFGLPHYKQWRKNRRFRTFDSVPNWEQIQVAVLVKMALDLFGLIENPWTVTSLSSIAILLTIISLFYQSKSKGSNGLEGVIYMPLVLLLCIRLYVQIQASCPLSELIGLVVYIWLSYSSAIIGAYFLVVSGQILNLIYHAERIIANPIHDFLAVLPTLIAVSWFLLFISELTRVAISDESGEVIIDGRMVSLEHRCSMLSYLTFSWANPLLKLGRDKPLEEEDLPHLTESDQMGNVIRNWTEFKKSTDHIIWSLLRFTKSFGIFQVTLSVLTTTLDFANPFFMNLILKFIQSNGRENVRDGIILIVGMFIANIVKAVLNSQIELSGRKWGMQIRAVLVHEILAKSLRRALATSSKSTDEDDDDDSYASTGKVVSLMSSDVGEIRNFLVDLHRPLIDNPLTIIIGIAGLLVLLGPSALIGLSVIVISSPISGLVMKWTYKIFKKTKILRDKRIQYTNEALQGIRIIKYMSWESQFLKKIRMARESELASRIYGLLGWVALWMVGWGSSILVVFTSLFTYTIIFEHTLDAATAFTCISLLGTVTWVLNDISQVVSEVMNIRLSISRIQKFLDEEEIDNSRFLKNEDTKLNTSTKLALSNASYQYYMSEKNTEKTLNEQSNLLDNPEYNRQPLFQLKNISVEFPIGKLSCIVGPTGSGKTSLILSILGEMKKIDGEILVPNVNAFNMREGELLHHGIAYVSQASWLLNATVRDNILFGEPYVAERYMKTLEACALIRDLKLLEGGDLTEIGEKGINLSGGQKQRISLARAAYSRASFILLDDPLSAVDSPTARHLFEKCILGSLRGRTILLVSHSASLVLPHSDFVVVLHNGSIQTSGPPKEVLQNVDVLELVSDSTEASLGGTVKQDSASDMTVSAEGTNLVDKEGKATGAIKFGTYIAYLKACGGWQFIFWISVAFSITTGASFLETWWIQQWTDSNQIGTEHTSLYYIGIFGIICFIEMLANIIQYVVQFYGGWHASKILHHTLLEAVLGAPLRFFETTPIGRLINRFSKDLSEIDTGVMWTVIRFGTLIFSAVSSLIIVSYVTPVFLFAIVLQFFYSWFARIYLSSSRELKRIESVSSSPIYAQFSEMINGIQTIRAYGSQRRLALQMQDKVDSNHRAFFYLFVTNRWLYFRNSILSGLVVAVAGLSVIFTGVSAGLAGLAFTFANQLTSKMSSIVQIHAHMEMSMNSVERVEEYSQITQEPAAIVEDFRPPSYWPMQGKIEFKNLSIRYDKSSPLVLRNVSFTVNSQEKVGIVGRTGAGKSTLSLALFRILPFDSGTIEIDSIDISKIGLKDLRSNLTVIAQDATLFEGTIRSNLDATGEHRDADIWQALRLSHFMDTLQKHDAKDPSIGQKLSLEDRVEENGSNFSQGQRNILCLARALLRKSKIIFLDEATASVDRDTDSKIQETIRSQFNHGTVLTVAHRLRTVMDYDRIVVFDQGEVKENGHPYDLIKRAGIFNSMCKESGEFNDLVEIARLAYVGKKS